MSDFELQTPRRFVQVQRSALESDGRVGLANAAETVTTLSEIRYGTSIQLSPTDLFLTFGLMRGSVLSALRRLL